MKLTLVVLSLACFVGTLYALPLNDEPYEEDAYGTFIELNPEILPNVEEEEYPGRPTRPPCPPTTGRPTPVPTQAPTTTSRPTPPRPTTSRPTPPRPTSSPTQRPTGRPTSRPSVRPPQFHHNAVKSQGPFSGRLTNVVFNGEGTQRTLQRNRIQYNMNPDAGVLKELFNDEDVQA